MSSHVGPDFTEWIPLMDMSGCTIWATLTPAQQTAAYQGAIEIIFGLTGNRFRTFTKWIHPDNCTCAPAPCAGMCGSYRDYINLSHYEWPILTIVQVEKDGAVLVENTDWYRADHNDRVYPIQGGALTTWPNHNFRAAPSAVGTFGIQVTTGEPVPTAAIVAAQDLACKWATSGGSSCEVPDGAVSVTRDGVTVKLETGALAIPSVKYLVQSYPPRTRPRGRRFIDPATFRGGHTR